MTAAVPGSGADPAADPATAPTLVSWTEPDPAAGAADATEPPRPHTALWRVDSSGPAPGQVQVADDRLGADAAWRAASAGQALLWRGDFQNARLLLQALARRIDRRPRKPGAARSLTDTFHQHRLAQAQRARLLRALLIPLDGDYAIPLRRAPDWREACTEAWGPAPGVPSVAPLRELLGLVGAHEWRKKGVEIPALGARIHPHHGVFSPVRGEYIDLVAQAPLPPCATLAFDIGTGTGVLAALLARRGVAHVVATDTQPRALACAQDNAERLGLSLGPAGQLELLATDLFPPGRAPLIVCNPPWLPGKPSSGLEHAVYDPDSRMLRGYLGGLAAHLAPGGEGWLILSDLAERLGLRGPDELAGRIAAAGLRVVGQLSARPRHPKALDTSDPLHAARSAEVTSLWRLAAQHG